MSKANHDVADDYRPQLVQVGRRMRRRREALGLGTVQLGEKAGLSHSYISRLERGLIPRPTLPELSAVARALEMPEQALLYGEMAEDDEAGVRQILRNPELQAAFGAIADGVEWAHPDDRKFLIASLQALAERSNAITLAGKPDNE